MAVEGRDHRTASPPVGAGPAPRALIVDDDDHARVLLLMPLLRSGFHCEQARDGLEALGWAVSSPFDLIVTDIAMPRVDGLVMLARLREHALLHDAGLIVVSAFPGYEARATEMGADVFLHKPVDPDVLLREARRLLARSRAPKVPRDERAQARPQASADAQTQALQAPQTQTQQTQTLQTQALQTQAQSPLRTQALAPAPPRGVDGERASGLSSGSGGDGALDPHDPIEGSFGELRPADLVGVLRGARRSASIEFRRAGGVERGVLVMHAGEVVAATTVAADTVTLEGARALESTLAWEAGTFVVRPTEAIPAAAITRNARTPRTAQRPRPEGYGEGFPLPGQELEEPFGTGVYPAAVVDVPSTGADPFAARVLADRSSRLVLPGGRIGPFEVETPLDEWAHGEVYRARRLDPSPARTSSRLIVQRSAPRTEDDLRRLAGLELPGVARVRSWGALEEGRSWVETDLPDGPTLDDLVRERGPFTPDLALSVFDSVASALARAHAAGLPHGALDARKVVLLPGGAVALLDHGISGRGAGPDDLNLVRTLAPEVWKGGPAEAPSDLYSMGALLFFALTGRYPFDGPSASQIGTDAVSTPSPSLASAGLPACDPKLEAAVEKLLSKDPPARERGAELLRDVIAERRPGASTLAGSSPGSESAPEGAPDVADVPGRARSSARMPKAEPTGAPEGGDAPSPPTGYRFTRWIAQGGFGDVYEGFHETLARVAAIKVVRRERASDAPGRARFLREARIAAAFSHPSIVQIIDAREERGRLYLILEYVDGESASARLRRRGALREAAAIGVIRQVLSALAAAHARGIVHRDVKPDNILLSRDGRAKVTDFGLARSLSGGERITRAGEILGTVHYLAPEQARGENVDERGDLYSAGATLFHLLSGRPPFDGTPFSVIEAHVYTEAPLIRTIAPHISENTEAVVRRLLAKDPKDRFSDACDVIEALGR